jgi:predicted nucleic acid-binding protein
MVGMLGLGAANCTAPCAGKPAIILRANPTRKTLASEHLIVLDTNVVLDWLLFRDPSAAAWSAAVEAGTVRWLATPAMRDELAHVLHRGLAAARAADTGALLARWDALATTQPEPVPHRLTCGDADDQKFIDLAFAAGARWLVSRDRALLRLARPAAVSGLTIVTPQRWAP